MIVNHFNQMQDPNLIQVQSQKLGQLLTERACSDLEQAIGQHFTVEGLGLTIAEGATPDRADFGRGISFLSEIPGMAQTIAVKAGFFLGDLILLARQRFGDEAAEDLIGEVCQATSKTRHTVQEAERISRGLVLGERVEGLTHSHHAVLIEAKRALTSEQVLEFVEWIKDGHKQGVLTASGASETLASPRSVREARKRLEELKSGKDEALEAELVDPTCAVCKNCGQKLPL